MSKPRCGYCQLPLDEDGCGCTIDDKLDRAFASQSSLVRELNDNNTALKVRLAAAEAVVKAARRLNIETWHGPAKDGGTLILSNTPFELFVELRQRITDFDLASNPPPADEKGRVPK